MNNSKSVNVKMLPKTETEDLTGKTFGCFNVLEFVPKESSPFPFATWKSRCMCGNDYYLCSYALKNGTLNSCGCEKSGSNQGRRITHGMSNSLLYKKWEDMKARTTNPNSWKWNEYGGRGIALYDDWNDFVNFADWAFDTGYEDNLTIERIDVNKGYEPSNCRWATMKEQGNNRRNNTVYTINGETLTNSEWAERAGLTPGGLDHRVKVLGWSLEEAVSTPSRKSNVRAKEEGKIIKERAEMRPLGEKTLEHCEDLTGQIFGWLRVVRPIGLASNGSVVWECECKCGAIVCVSAASLKSKTEPTKSCGCYSTEILKKYSTTHGMSQTKIYRVWLQIKKKNEYAVSVLNKDPYVNCFCQEWEDVTVFANWAYSIGFSETNGEKYTVDRINPEDTWNPNNCILIEKPTNGAKKPSIIYEEYNGEKHSLAEWGELLGIKYVTLLSRYNKGWRGEKLFAPPKPRKRQQQV